MDAGSHSRIGVPPPLILFLPPALQSSAPQGELLGTRPMQTFQLESVSEARPSPGTWAPPEGQGYGLEGHIQSPLC